MMRPAFNRNRSTVRPVLIGLAGLLLLGILSTGIQLAANLSIKPRPQRPSTPIDVGGLDRLLTWYGLLNRGQPLPEGITLTENFVKDELKGTFAYIDGRYDCSDFRMNSLVRLYLSFGDRLPPSVRTEAERVMLGLKYWMDQGGADSMCYWSENHQILFAVCEYLVGQRFPDRIFTVDGKTGREHRDMARTRIDAWMRQRFLYGFTEWYSNNYYPEDVGPMANFIQFSEEPELVNRMKMVMDLLWHDMASQSFRYGGVDPEGRPRRYYIFASSSGRAFSGNRVGDDLGNRMRHFIDFVMQPAATRHLKNGWFFSKGSFFNCFRQMYEARDGRGQPFYEVPGVIRDIFDDPAPERLRLSSQSLNVEELA